MVLWPIIKLNRILGCSEAKYEKLVQVTTEIEYFQRAFQAYAILIQNTTWTASFKSEYESTDVGVSEKAGIKGLYSGNLGVDVSNALEEVAFNADYKKNTEFDYKKFGNDLQLVRRIITVISIGGTSVRNEKEETVDFYPHSQLHSTESLKKMAIEYMKDTYQPTASMVPNEKIAFFEQSACTFGI